MFVDIDGQLLEVIIIRKMANKNTYLRLKEDKKIYVSTNYFTPKFMIENFVKKNKTFIQKHLSLREKIAEAENFFLGEKLEEKKSDAWYRKEAKIIFKERLDLIHRNFSRKIPYPILHIRKMTSRWGVCNLKLKKVTLNLELIKKDLFYIDYVIVHELAHFIYPNHSKEFWALVEENFKDYKLARKNLKNHEYKL